MGIIKKIPSLSDEELFNLFNNALNLLDDAEKKDDAVIVLNALKEEWRIRAEKAADGVIKLGAPKVGLLKRIGYKVGIDGARESVRLKLLDFIMTADVLPFVWSSAYMAEWGDQLSKKRYNKLQSVIRSLAFKNRNLPNIEKAIIDWQSDSEYLLKNWKHKVY